MKKIIFTEAAPAPIGPYSQAVLIRDTVYVSGQIAIDQTTGNIVSGNIQDETHQVMKNLGFILKEAGSDFSQVIKCSIFVKNMGDFGKINDAYGSYFPIHPPARETVEVSGLPKNVNVEISCVAYI